jgi:hypothetical protein
VAWWGWLLLAWPVVAVVGAVVLGRVIRTADERDRRRNALGESGRDDGRDDGRTEGKPTSGLLRGIPRQGRR